MISLRLVNGSTGDPALYIDFPGRDDAILFDAGEICSLGMELLGDLAAVFVTHHHVDHFIGFDRIVRANLDRDKALSVYGPEGTIRKVYDRIKSYEYQFFPFQKVAIRVHEVLPGLTRRAVLECTRRFPEPEIHEAVRADAVVHDTETLSVEAVAVDHTTACLAFALVLKPGMVPDAGRIGAGPPGGGPWVGEALERFRTGAPEESTMEVRGKAYTLGELRRGYFTETPGTRIAYVTDTAWSERVRPELIGLARGAERLYCDSFYAQKHAANAEKHRHMTATQAAEFAREAGVGALVLIHFASRYEGGYQALVDEAKAIFPNVSAEIPEAVSAGTRRRGKRGA